MTLEQIKGFLMAVDCGSIGRAASKMFVSTSTLSYQIKSLEEELGFPLLERTYSGVVPTEAGKYLAQRMGNSLKEIDKAIETAQVQQRKSLHFSIALGCSYPYSKLGEKIDILLKKYPRAQINLLPMESKDPMQPILNNSADVLITYEQYVLSVKNTVFRPIETSEMYCIMKKSRETGDITLSEVASLPLFFPKSLDKYSTFRHVYDDILSINPGAELRQSPSAPIQDVFTLVEKGEGAVLAHQNNARLAANSPDLTVRHLPGYAHVIGVCWLKDNEREIMNDFAEICKAIC